MDWEYEEAVVSILRGRKGWDENYSSISEFKEELEEADLAHEKLTRGWIFWREKERQQRIVTLFKHFASADWFWRNCLVQYWGVMKVEGRNHYLSTSNYPFCVGTDLKKGPCWYRKLCMDHVYVVDIQGDDDDDQEQQLIGGVGRAYRNKRPESSPDLRLYSTDEFTMRDEAARCGFRGYLALPLFDSHTNQCYGVMELLSDDDIIRSNLLSTLDAALQIVELRSSHSSVSLSDFPIEKQQPETEIREILEFAMETIPRLYLAVVWVPCKQCLCANMTHTNLCCMEITSFITSQTKRLNSHPAVDFDSYVYLEACEFHHLQIDPRCCLDSSSICNDLSISKNPLAHYAQRARLSHSFAVYLINVYNSNHLYVIQFFHQDAHGDYCLHLLSRRMEMVNLKIFKFVSKSQNSSAMECESTDCLSVMKSYKQELSVWDFMTYLERDDSCCLQPSPKGNSQGWVFRINNSSLVPKLLIEEKIENFMNNIQFFDWRPEYMTDCMIQFWAPKMVEDRCYLQASDQPFVVGCLDRSLALFRKKCTTHSYFVDDEAKEEELGPPGRVFRNGYPEISHGLFYYTTKECPIRNYAMRSCSLSNPGYLALPVFDDEHDHKCVGVLELIGFSPLEIEPIGRELKAAKLCSTHTDLYPRYLADEQPVNIVYGREEALTEVRNALELICKIPQLYTANVWVPNGEFNSNTSCMELALSKRLLERFRPVDQIQSIHVHSRKGMIGMVLASENKSCFCRNLCELGIVDQPLSHLDRRDRRDVCFAICLQSSHTGDLFYVMEFFLYQGPATCEYVGSFLNFLLPIMKHELKSFKMASGKELGEHLVVEVIEFSDASKLDYSCVSEEEADVFPVKFKSVQYNQEEHQPSEEQQTEECSVAASDCITSEKGKGKTGLNLILEVLKPQFRKKLKDVAKEFCGVRSTIKHACRNYGIDRWPTKECYKKNPSLFEGKTSTNPQLPSTSNHQPLDTNAESTGHLIVQKEVEKVMVKVKYGEDIIKFELCLSLGLAKLMEEVAAGLNLAIGTFRLKYLDEDGDEILLTRDVDLELCWKSQIRMDKTFIQLFIR